MPQQTNPPAKRRLLPTTFRGKDVAVIVTAAITAAAPYFAQQNDAKANGHPALDEYVVTRQLEDMNHRLYDISHELRLLNAKIQFLEAKHRDEIDEGDITPPPPITDGLDRRTRR